MHSRRALAIQRSQMAFARGAWTGVVMICLPVAVKTASNASVYLASRARHTHTTQPRSLRTTCAQMPRSTAAKLGCVSS